MPTSVDSSTNQRETRVHAVSPGTMQSRVLRVAGLVLGFSVLLAVPLWWTREAYFWQDDFVFLTQAKEMGLSWDLVMTPLFTHFSPIAWLYHWLVEATGDEWWIARTLMALTLLSIALGLYAVLREYVVGQWLSFLAGATIVLSIMNARNLSWWSAYVQDVPQVVLLLLTVWAWLRLSRTNKPIYAAAVGLGGLLNCLAYELGYLLPIFLAGASLFRVQKVRDALRQTRMQWAALAVTVVFAIGGVAYNRLAVPSDVPKASLAKLLELFAAFFPGSTITAITGFPPPDSWLVVAVIVVVLASLLGLLARMGAVSLASLLGWLIPVLTVSAALSIARAGYDVGSGFPTYPGDYQYQPLMVTWTVLFIALSASNVVNLAADNVAKRYSQVVTVWAVALVGLTLIATVSGSYSSNAVLRQLGTGGSGATYARTLMNLGLDQYVVNRSVPFVSASFGKYSSLQVDAPLLGISPGKVMSGINPQWITDAGELVPLGLAESRVLLTPGPGERCIDLAKVAGSPGNFRTPAFRASSGEVLLLNAVQPAKAKIAIYTLYGLPDGQTRAQEIGNADKGSTSIAFEVPWEPDTNRGVVSVDPFGLQLQGLSAAHLPCFAELRAFQAPSR